MIKCLVSIDFSANITQFKVYVYVHVQICMIKFCMVGKITNHLGLCTHKHDHRILFLRILSKLLLILIYSMKVAQNNS